MTDTYLEKTRGSLRRLRSIANNLYLAAETLYEVGQDRMADRIAAAAQGIAECEHDIDEAIGENINRQFRQSQESTGNILKAALAGISLANAKDKP